MYEPTVGYRNFHPQEHFNFQFNRWLPFLPEQELEVAAKRIQSFDDWFQVMLELAERAQLEERSLHAAFYYRAAEFFLANNQPQKKATYDQFIKLFYKNCDHLDFRKLKIPYQEGFLPAIVIEPEIEVCDTLVVHGGFDSFMEELFPQLESFVKHGFRIVAFEGPGQGAALKVYGLPMTHQWEKPVSCVLDYLDIDECTLIGISLGGYLATRAAAFEPRIKRVVADDVLEDFFGCISNRLGRKKSTLIKWLLRWRLKSLTNRLLDTAAQKDVVTAWALEQGKHVSGTDCAYSYLKWTQLLNTRDVSHRLKQDYLLLAAQSDHLVPIEQFFRQAQSLTHVRSFTGRIFTDHESAGNHCHVGNQSLAMNTILTWLLALKETG